MSGNSQWTNIDFVESYYFGGGSSIDLYQIGHLQAIAEQVAYGDNVEGAFRRLTDQIADAARAAGAGALHYKFSSSYEFEGVAFSHGDGVVQGEFIGIVEKIGDMLHISGETKFQFSDIFADPLDIGVEVGGDPYEISGTWDASFLAEVLVVETGSVFTAGKEP